MITKKRYQRNEGTGNAVWDLFARTPVIAYLGESGGGEDRCIELEGDTLFDKMLGLYDAGTYVSIGPAEGSEEWNALDKEDQRDYRILQAQARKANTFKKMGDFLSRICADSECFLFALRQGNNAVWVNPDACTELEDSEWTGDDADWLSNACSNWEAKKNERGNYYDDFIANVILQVRKGSGATGLEYQDDKLYFIYIGIDELTKALREAGVSEELLAGEDTIKVINDTLSYHDDLGKVDVETWESPSQYFEDPGDGGSRATLDLNDKDQWHEIYYAVQVALRYYALSVLDLFGASDGNFAEWDYYGEADIPDIMKEVASCTKLQASLKEMNLTNADAETLLKAAINPDTAIDPGNLIIELDGDVDDNW